MYYLTYLKDTIGNNYLGIDIPPNEVEPYLKKLKIIIGNEYECYIENQKNRDFGNYHISVINVSEYNRLCNEIGISNFVNSLELVFKWPIDDIEFLGIGTAKSRENQSYFIVVNSEKLNAIRKRYNLGEFDFHITLGFKWKDVFGVRKNEILPDIDPFLKLLAKEYYNKNQTFDFIKFLPDFQGDIMEKIEPIRIGTTEATFKTGKFSWIKIKWMENNFKIVEDGEDKELVILPHTEINKIFKNILK